MAAHFLEVAAYAIIMIPVIREIILNFYTDPNAFNARSTETLFTTGAALSGATETMWLSGMGYDETGAILHTYEVWD